MKNELREYESPKAGQFRFDSLKIVAELPHVLIKARIARGLSQKDLAELIGLKEQQIQGKSEQASVVSGCWCVGS